VELACQARWRVVAEQQVVVDAACSSSSPPAPSERSLPLPRLSFVSVIARRQAKVFITRARRCRRRRRSGRPPCFDHAPPADQHVARAPLIGTGSRRVDVVAMIGRRLPRDDDVGALSTVGDVVAGAEVDHVVSGVA